MLEVRDVSKAFGEVQALRHVDATFRPGEIHAVLGENGAGKSTLMHVLSGFVRPDSGDVFLGGMPLPLGKPFECKGCGVGMVHQHFTLVPNFTVEENLALGNLPDLKGRLDLDGLSNSATSLAKELGWQIDPHAKVRDLPVGVQQRIEILKAISKDEQVLIFDEPTAVLTPDEVEDLFRVLRDLRSRGKTIILIAHKLAEIVSVADRVTVLRRGAVVATALMSETDERQLAEWMVGQVPSSEAPPPGEPGEVQVRVEELALKGDRGESAVRGVSFTIRAGEILGFGGVDGNGQVELAEALAGIRPPEAGRIEAPAEPAYIPQDRQLDGLALGMSIQDNVLLSGHRREDLTRGPFLRPKPVYDWAESLIAKFSIKAMSPKVPVSVLSGGNQQKVVVSRNLDRVPEFLVVVNPTRGLDIAATQFVHEQIRNAAAAGAAVALFSTDAEELADLSHRSYFMSRGELYDSAEDALIGSRG